MWTPGESGVLLHRMESPESDKIIIKFVREKAVDIADPQYPERFNDVTSMTLHLSNDGTENYNLDYDPWSDINVISDGSIDDKDIDAITRLALAFYHQTTISSPLAVFLSLGPDDLVETFNPGKPIKPVTPSMLSVHIVVLDLTHSEEPVFNAGFHAASFDEGTNFTVRRMLSTGPDNEITPGLEDLAKAFIRLKV